MSRPKGSTSPTGRTVISQSLTFYPKTFQYIADQSQAKMRSFSAEARDLIMHGIKARDGQAALTAVKEKPKATTKQPQQRTPKPTKVRE